MSTGLLEFFDVGRRRDGGSFDAGIQFALERMLVDPDFLLRVYRDPPVDRDAAASSVYPLSDLEVASRLSFFLWSSIPDETPPRIWPSVASSTEAGRARGPRCERMLADPARDRHTGR